MHILQHRPTGPLGAWVDQIWCRRGRVSHPRRHSAVPTGSVDLTFNLADGPLQVFTHVDDCEGQSFNDAVVHGAHTKYFVLDARSDVDVIGVHFRPGGGAALLGLPAHELTDRHIGLDDIWGPYARDLRAQLVEAAAPDAKLRFLEATLLERLRRATLVHPAISFALRGIRSSPDEVRIGALQRETGYSPRRFTTLFARDVGLTPKMYSRIQRLRHVVEHVAQAGAGDIDWAAIASDHGYYDQSHLTRDFREFTGQTPASYRPISAQSALHMALRDPKPRLPG
jgi:AraC-like DNA-binding protein